MPHELPPESIIKAMSNKLTLIEYISNNVTFKKEKEIINQIIKKAFPDFYQNFIMTEETLNNQFNNQNDKMFFKMKLSSYCVYNFWVYIFITGEYDTRMNQSLLNIDIRTNNLKGLNIIAKEKNSFVKELLHNIVVIY